MISIQDKISQIVAERLLSNPEIFLVDVIYIQKGSRGKLEVILDGDKGVHIDDCAEISRKLGAIIEEENIIEVAYLLEVASPGIGTPLKLKRQYHANIGRILSIEQIDGQIIAGKLISVDEDTIHIETFPTTTKKPKVKVVETLPSKEQQPSVSVNFAAIKKAMVQVVF